MKPYSIYLFRKRRPLFLLLGLLALGNSGCLVVAAGAAAGGAATYLYVKGKVCQDYPATFVDSWQAVHSGLQALALPVVSQQNDGRTGTIVSRAGDGSTITVDLEVIPSRIPAEGTLTRVCVRVGTFGDTAVSERILAHVGAHLIPAGQVPRTPPASSASPPAWTPATGKTPPVPLRPETIEPPGGLPPQPVPVTSAPAINVPTGRSTTPPQNTPRGENKSIMPGG